jgi:hypothetical protein
LAGQDALMAVLLSVSIAHDGAALKLATAYTRIAAWRGEPTRNSGRCGRLGM